MLRNIGAHFSRSCSRQVKFKEFQDFFKTELHKNFMPSLTRWLSMEQCTNRVLEQYEALKAHFREANFEDSSRINDTIFKCLDNYFTKIYLEYMSYVLGIINEFNTLFQSEVPLLHRLKPEVYRILKIFYANCFNEDQFKSIDIFTFDHKNPRHCLQLRFILQ